MNQFEMKQRAYQSSLKSRALQVLLYLIDRANREQTCFPAVPTIGRELHISISTVKRAMKELVESGYVTKESRFHDGNRGQTSNLYTLHFPEKENMVDRVVIPKKLVQMEQLEQTDVESVCIAEEYTELQCGKQDIGKAKNISVTENVDNINEAAVSGDGYKLMEQINNYLGKTFICISLWPGEGVNLIPP